VVLCPVDAPCLVGNAPGLRAFPFIAPASFKAHDFERISEPRLGLRRFAPDFGANRHIKRNDLGACGGHFLSLLASCSSMPRSFACDPEPFASGAELASEVRRGQSEVLLQELEPVFFEIDCGAVGSGNADALHPPTVATLISDLPLQVCSKLFGSGFSVTPVSEEFLDAWVRMLRLMDRPDEGAVLAPAYEREILFRVLQGQLGWMLRDIAAPDAALSRIGVAIQWIRQNFAKPLRVDAEMAALSVSAFHRHFKAVTALSPIQQVRLLHARTLLMAGGGSATSVSFCVGYESPNQFSREYARQFGLPPSKDVVRLRGEAA
jgi:AraC-like DNA-binding protein